MATATRKLYTGDSFIRGLQKKIDVESAEGGGPGRNRTASAHPRPLNGSQGFPGLVVTVFHRVIGRAFGIWRPFFPSYGIWRPWSLGFRVYGFVTWRFRILRCQLGEGGGFGTWVPSTPKPYAAGDKCHAAVCVWMQGLAGTPRAGLMCQHNLHMRRAPTCVSRVARRSKEEYSGFSLTHPTDLSSRETCRSQRSAALLLRKQARKKNKQLSL